MTVRRMSVALQDLHGPGVADDFARGNRARPVFQILLAPSAAVPPSVLELSSFVVRTGALKNNAALSCK